MATTSFRGREFRAIVSGEAFPDRQSRELGAGQAPDNPDAPAQDRGVDAASRNFKRPPFVAALFQVSKDSVEDQLAVIKARDILPKNPEGLNPSDKAKHVRPEETVVSTAASLPGDREGLAGEAPREEREIRGETGEAGGEGEASNSSKDVQLAVVEEIVMGNGLDGTLVNMSMREASVGNATAEYAAAKGVYFVVVGRHERSSPRRMEAPSEEASSSRVEIISGRSSMRDSIRRAVGCGGMQRCVWLLQVYTVSSETPMRRANAVAVR
jgi:hypothetical protein